jgi:hypothetical protein
MKVLSAREGLWAFLQAEFATLVHLHYIVNLASMLLNSFEERGLIKRFREGRENVVHKMDV